MFNTQPNAQNPKQWRERGWGLVHGVYSSVQSYNSLFIDLHKQGGGANLARLDPNDTLFFHFFQSISHDEQSGENPNSANVNDFRKLHWHILMQYN